MKRKTYNKIMLAIDAMLEANIAVKNDDTIREPWMSMISDAITQALPAIDTGTKSALPMADDLEELL